MSLLSILRSLGAYVLLEGIIAGLSLLAIFLGVISQRSDAAFLGLAVLIADYIFYRIRGFVATRREWERAKRISVADILKFQEGSITMTESIHGKALPETEMHRYEWVIGIVKPGRYRRVLDVGCAEGIATLKLASMGKSVIGIDIGRKLVAEGSEKAAKENLDAYFLVADFEHLPFADSSFDAVMCSEAIEHLVNPSNVFSEIRRVLKPGGTAVFTTENANHMPFSINPLIWLETIFGVWFAPLLSYRPWAVHVSWEKSDDKGWFVHRNFTFGEIRGFVVRSGLVLREQKSFEFPIATALVLLFRLPLDKWEVIEHLLEHAPLLGYLGRHQGFVIEKQKV